MSRPLFSFALSALLAAGCATTETGPTTDRIVMAPEQPEPEAEPKQPPEWFDEQIAQAEEAYKANRIYEALKIVYDAREQEPAEPHASRLANLLRRLNEGVLEIDTVAGEVRPETDPVTFGDALRVRVRVRNVGPHPVTIPARLKGASDSVLALDVIRTERDVRAQIVTDRRRVYKKLDRDLAIPSGGSVEIIVDLGVLGNDRALDGFREYTIGGVLRPVVLIAGGLRRWEPVPLEPGRIRSFRANYEHLADDPVRRVGQAIEKGAPVHLLTACALVPYARRRDAVDRLVASVQRGRAIDWAMFGALRYLTEVDFSGDPAAWKAWWPRVRETYFDEPGRRRSELPDFGR